MDIIIIKTDFYTHLIEGLTNIKCLLIIQKQSFFNQIHCLIVVNCLKIIKLIIMNV